MSKKPKFREVLTRVVSAMFSGSDKKYIHGQDYWSVSRKTFLSVWSLTDEYKLLEGARIYKRSADLFGITLMAKDLNQKTNMYFFCNSLDCAMAVASEELAIAKSERNSKEKSR